MRPNRTHLLVVAVFLLVPLSLKAQVRSVVIHERVLTSNIIIPQSRPFRPPGASVEVTAVKVGVVIVERVATTTMDVTLHNRAASRAEAELMVPVPDGAVIRGFTFQGAAAEPTAELLPKDEARRTYNAIVAKIRDPAILEFAGYNLIRSSVFPVEANSDQKVRLTYEHILSSDGDRIDYILPRTESIEYTVPWDISVRMKSPIPVSTVYSPSHAIDVSRPEPNIASVRLTEAARTEPGPFRLSFLLEKNGVTASLLAYPDAAAGGGYFLLLAGLPSVPSVVDGKTAIKREVTLVLDRSGSMNGEKLQQVREAALQILAGLEPEESFNIITYNEAVELFSPTPVKKNDQSIAAATAFLKSITARGGTNIHDALVEALRQKVTPSSLPLVLFLTDGLPTVGETREAAIRDAVLKSNIRERRIFTFGVGVDVNTPLLDSIAVGSRACATYVLPKEDVEVKVAGIFSRLSGPVLASAELTVMGPNGEPAPGRVIDLLPTKLPDMFKGDQLVLLGRYVGDSPLSFRLIGNYLGRKRRFEFTFNLDKATTRNSFIPRLWASRKIGVLIDQIRGLGAGNSLPTVHNLNVSDPRLKELTSEIVRLSTEFGILTEYTSFLAREGTDLTRRDAVLQEANVNFQTRAVATRSGIGSVNQSFNSDFMNRQGVANFRNQYYDANMNRVEITRVQQINDRAFFRQGNRWVDSQTLNAGAAATSLTTVVYGSPEYNQLVEKLTQEHRPGVLSLKGEIVITVDGRNILVTGTSE